jgi:hypothetical protein
MDSKMAMVAAWSYGMAGFLAAFLACSIWRPVGEPVGAVARCSWRSAISAVWGMLGLAFALTQQGGLSCRQPAH